MSRFASLTSRLVATAVGLVVVVAVLIGIVATTALHARLVDQLDDDLRAIAGVRPIGDGPGSAGPPPGDLPSLDRRGGPETLTAIITGSRRDGEVITGRADAEAPRRGETCIDTASISNPAAPDSTTSTC